MKNAATAPSQPPDQQILGQSPSGTWWWWYVVGLMSSILVPCIIINVGMITQVLEDNPFLREGIVAAEIEQTPIGAVPEKTFVFGQWLAIPKPSFLARQTPVFQLLILVGAGLLLAWTQATLLFLFYRGLFRRVRCLIQNLHQQVLSTSIQVAQSEGITAQQIRTRQLIEGTLPQLHQGLFLYWRAIPRSIVLTIVCTALAVSIDVWLTIMALIGGLVVWIAYRSLLLRSRVRSARFDLHSIRKRLLDEVQLAPLVARVRGEEISREESGGPLQQLAESDTVHDRHAARIVPTVFAMAVFFIALFIVALGGNILVRDSSLSLAAALVLILSLLGAVTGAIRTIRAFGRQGEFHDASSKVITFIDRPAADRGEERLALPKIREGIEFSNVTMLDGTGRLLLDRLSLQLQPGSLVALLGTDVDAVRTLVELLMGFGTPKSGIVSIDGVPIHDLHHRWFSKNVLWVSSSGPVWTGTITENFSFANQNPDSGAVSDATRRAGVYDRIQAMSDGFATLISSDDARIDELTRYGIGIARAWIRRPLVVIVQEPPLMAGTLADDPALETLTELAAGGSLVIMLSQRLRTLRQANRVILINDGRIAGEGKHETLLGDSDLYRHLNYTLFNPYRHKPAVNRR